MEKLIECVNKVYEILGEILEAFKTCTSEEEKNKAFQKIIFDEILAPAGITRESLKIYSKSNKEKFKEILSYSDIAVLTGIIKGIFIYTDDFKTILHCDEYYENKNAEMFLSDILITHNSSALKDINKYFSKHSEEFGNYISSFSKEYKVGDIVIYQNGDKFELGIIKTVCGNDEYFVNYHIGDTAAKTHARNLHKISNAYAFNIVKENSND